MTQPRPIVKELSSSHGDRLIRVSVVNPRGDGFHASTFPENEIQSVDDMGQDRSALVLRSGAVIPVAISYKDLEQKIYFPNFSTEGPVLDLREVTGAVATPAPGDQMPDGTIYAGISPDTGKAMYAIPADVSLTMPGAKEYAQGLNTQKAHGHDDWHLPTMAELNVLFNNRAAIGGFALSASNPDGRHWSFEGAGRWDAWGQRFSDGGRDYNDTGIHSLVRCVR